MLSKKVLIAYASRFGSTEEISIKYKQVLEEKGFIVDLINLKSRSTNPKKLNVNDYSGLLIGSGIRVSRWTKEAKSFLKAYTKQINSGKILVGVYLSSGEASDPEKRPEAVEKYLLNVFNEFNIDLGDHLLYDAFGGIYDLSKDTNLNWLNKRMLTMAANYPEPDSNPAFGIGLNQRKDLRDWDQINNFIEIFISKFQ